MESISSCLLAVDRVCRARNHEQRYAVSSAKARFPLVCYTSSHMRFGGLLIVDLE